MLLGNRNKWLNEYIELKYSQSKWHWKRGFGSTVDFHVQSALLFGWTFESIQIGLYSSPISHVIVEILRFVWYVNTSTAYVTMHDLMGNQEYHGWSFI